MPLERYRDFTAPILAHSIDDDNWGQAESVDSMMQHYPNVQRSHLIPLDYQIDKLGHFGYFLPKSKAIWEKDWEWVKKSISLLDPARIKSS